MMKGTTFISKLLYNTNDLYYLDSVRFTEQKRKIVCHLMYFDFMQCIKLYLQCCFFYTAVNAAICSYGCRKKTCIADACVIQNQAGFCCCNGNAKSLFTDLRGIFFLSDARIALYKTTQKFFSSLKQSFFIGLVEREKGNALFF